MEAKIGQTPQGDTEKVSFHFRSVQLGINLLNQDGKELVGAKSRFTCDKIGVESGDMEMGGQVDATNEAPHQCSA